MTATHVLTCRLCLGATPIFVEVDETDRYVRVEAIGYCIRCGAKMREVLKMRTITTTVAQAEPVPVPESAPPAE